MKSTKTKRQVNVRLNGSARRALTKLCSVHDLSQGSLIGRLLERELAQQSLSVLGPVVPAQQH